MSKISSFRILFFLMYIPAIFLLAGCADDLRNRKLFGCGGGDAVISYSVADVILTRDGENEDFESAVDHAYLLFYSSDASLASAAPLAAVKAECVPGNPGTLKFEMPTALQPKTDYQILAIANADCYTPSGFDDFGAYLESWCTNHSTSEYSPILLFSSTVIDPGISGILPMSGEVKDGSFFRFSLDDGVYRISSALSFRRKVARIDVANIVKDGFKVEGVMLCNWREAVDAYLSEEIVGNRLGTVRGVLSEESVSDDQFIMMPEAGEDGLQRLSKKIYCFPSVSYDSHMGDKESTALIIKAKYGGDTESSYYRVNVGINGNVSEVKANTKYLVTIQSVKGRGAPTPQEAYEAKESPIVLSVVEDWDLEGEAFDMDDKGNFMVLSRGSLSFEGNSTEQVEVRILTSGGLDWSCRYIASDEASDGAFHVEKLSDSSLSISPKGMNESDVALTGICRVSASTGVGTELNVNISLCQNVSEEKPQKPIIPDDMPFALVPESYDRVKIDHIERTIEIDGFDPDCFNSFIDIPFIFYVNDSYKDLEITVNSDMEWPLEGRFFKTTHEDYFYCSNSFAKDPAVFSKSKNQEFSRSQFIGFDNIVEVTKDERIYLTVGAMAPDDPAIKRTITITGYSSNPPVEVVYDLEIKPRQAVIDDVILIDENGNSWLIFDRNIQELSSYAPYKDIVGRLSDGRKLQAYNNLILTPPVVIPFKYKVDGTAFDEATHSLYGGTYVKYGSRASLNSETTSNSTSIRYKWLGKYLYKDGNERTSPFYEESNIDKWIFPSGEVMELCKSKMRVSKMRMFLISDVPALSGKKEIPVCCYWPYIGYKIEDTSSNAFGYFSSEDAVNLSSMVIIYHDKTEMKIFVPSSSDINNYYGLSRLVRPILEDELTDYKINYLGYGEQPHKLTPCHPDTYESTSLGWIPY